jgi:hypothetical protein
VRYRHDVSFGNQAAFVALTVLCWYELEPVDCLALVRGRMAPDAATRLSVAPPRSPLPVTSVDRMTLSQCSDSIYRMTKHLSYAGKLKNASCRSRLCPATPWTRRLLTRNLRFDREDLIQSRDPQDVEH